MSPLLVLSVEKKYTSGCPHFRFVCLNFFFTLWCPYFRFCQWIFFSPCDVPTLGFVLGIFYSTLGCPHFEFCPWTYRALIWAGVEGPTIGPKGTSLPQGLEIGAQSSPLFVVEPKCLAIVSEFQCCHEDISQNVDWAFWNMSGFWHVYQNQYFDDHILVPTRESSPTWPCWKTSFLIREPHIRMWLILSSQLGTAWLFSVEKLAIITVEHTYRLRWDCFWKECIKRWNSVWGKTVWKSLWGLPNKFP